MLQPSKNPAGHASIGLILARAVTQGEASDPEYMDHATHLLLVGTRRRAVASLKHLRTADLVNQNTENFRWI